MSTYTAPNVAGAWVVTIEPNPRCQGWPAAIGTRRYLAEVTQHSSRLLIDFSGATFEGSTRFKGLAYEDRVTLHLDWWDGAPSLVERLDDGRFLGISGWVSTSVDASLLKGELDGRLRFGTKPLGSDDIASCKEMHRVELKRIP